MWGTVGYASLAAISCYCPYALGGGLYKAHKTKSIDITISNTVSKQLDNYIFNRLESALSSSFWMGKAMYLVVSCAPMMRANNSTLLYTQPAGQYGLIAD